jgi:alanine racemase
VIEPTVGSLGGSGDFAALRRPSWCEIDLDAVTHNVGQVRSLVGPGVSVFVCLKNEAIGCGVERLARHCQSIGVDGLALGNLDLVLSFRSSGVTLPVLLYPSSLPETAPLLEAMNVMPTISTIDDVERWSRSCKTELAVFLKVDGGGYRAGAFPSDALKVARAIQSSGNLRLVGAYGHPMADYGFDAPGYVDGQIAAVTNCMREFERNGVHLSYRIASSSGLLLKFPEADLNCVDPGRLIMGIPFSSIPERSVTWRSALVAVKSRIVMVKSLDHTGEVPEAPFMDRQRGMRIGLMPLGWADGLSGDKQGACDVLVKGIRTRTIGPIHAELTRIDLTHVPDACVGDEAVIIGRSGDDEITVDQLSKAWGKDCSEIYMGLGKYLPKVYRVSGGISQ